MRNLLVVRGTSWVNLWNWRVREMFEQPWHLLATSEPLAEYPSRLTPVEVAKLVFAEFPNCKLYMRIPDPEAPPEKHENLVVGQIMPFFQEPVPVGQFPEGGGQQ